MKDIKDKLTWWKYCFWKQGIGPNEFNNTPIRDIREIMQIEQAVTQRGKRHSKVMSLMNKMTKW